MIVHRAPNEMTKKPTSLKKQLQSSLGRPNSGVLGCTSRLIEPATTDVTNSAPPSTLFKPTCILTISETDVLFVDLKYRPLAN